MEANACDPTAVPTRLLLVDTISQLFHTERRVFEQSATNSAITRGSDVNVGLQLDGVEEQKALGLDPLNWKQHDHYAILGLKKARCRASDEEVRQAYRKLVLVYHPDKLEAPSRDDTNFFKCIQKSYELLSNTTTRRHYDSIDPTYDDEIPSIVGPLTEAQFLKHFSPLFEREGRFSKAPDSQKLEDVKTRADLEDFYDFWYRFDSWRTFEWLDEDDIESAENRDDKRWMDRQNRAERLQRKKDDNTRVRKLVDLAASLDPRIQRFKEAEKQEREAKKQERIRQRERERLEAREARLKAQQEREEEDKRLQDAKKKEEQERKKTALLQEARKRELGQEILSVLSTQFSYLSRKPLSHAEIRAFENRHSEAIEVSRDPEKIEEYLEKIKGISPENLDWDTVASEYQQFLDTCKYCPTVESELFKRKSDKVESSRPWSAEEVKALVAAANKLPGGIQQRWEKIARLVAHETGQPERSSSEVIEMCKTVKRGKGNIQAVLAQLQTERKALGSQLPPGQDSPQTAGEIWTAAQQQKLQRALQMYPPSLKADDRWDRIAAMVDGKSKKECVLRVKYLAAQVKKRKEGREK